MSSHVNGLVADRRCRTHPRPKVLAAATAAVVAVVLIGVVVVLEKGPAPMTITARFATAPGLYPGNRSTSSACRSGP